MKSEWDGLHVRLAREDGTLQWLNQLQVLSLPTTFIGKVAIKKGTEADMGWGLHGHGGAVHHSSVAGMCIVL